MKTNQRFLVSRNKREGNYFGMYWYMRSRNSTLKGYVKYLKAVRTY